MGEVINEKKVMLCHFMYSLRLCQFYEQLQGGNENEDVARDKCLRYTSCSLFVRISEASAIADYVGHRVYPR